MTKKILAVLMAAVLMLGMFAAVVSAEDEEPAYTPVEYKIADLVAALENGEAVYLNPKDVIVLFDNAEQPDSGDPTAAAEGDPETPVANEDAVSSVLIVEYLPGQDAASITENTKFVDYESNGYAVKGMGEYTKYAYKNTERRGDFLYPIDFANANEYPFEKWEVDSIYSGKEFNRIVLVAQWQPPELHGWSGFMTMFRSYAKTLIDYFIQFVQDWFAQLGVFLTGSSGN